MSELEDSIREILGRTTSNAERWTEAERNAYDNAGGWGAGAKAVRDLRVAEIIALVRSGKGCHE